MRATVPVGLSDSSLYRLLSSSKDKLISTREGELKWISKTEEKSVNLTHDSPRFDFRLTKQPLLLFFFLSMLRFPGRFDCWGKTVLALLVWEFGSIWQLHLWVSTNIFSVESAVVVRLVALTRQYAWESSASCDRALGALQAGLVRLITQGFCSFCLGCLSPNTLRPSPLVLPVLTSPPIATGVGRKERRNKKDYN